MRALLVQSRSPTTYWSFEHSLPFLGKAATHPPLGIATLAALLPPHWSCACATSTSRGAFFRAVWRLGVRGSRRRLFWKLVAKGFRRGFDMLPRAVTFAIVGESLIRYTEEVVLPRIGASLAELPAAARSTPAVLSAPAREGLGRAEHGDRASP
jgi:hypothetical protein